MKSSNILEKDYNFEGRCKVVKGPDSEGYVYKYFKKDIEFPSLVEQKRILEAKKQYFWKYIPETEFFEQEDGTYYIKQKYIKGVLLKNVDIHELSPKALSSLLDLFHSYILYSKKEKQQLDIFWYQEYSDEMNIWEKRFRNFLKVYKNFLLSSNIIITPDWMVFMIDVCDDKKIGIPSHLQRIKNLFAQPFIFYMLNKISKLIIEKKSEIGKILQWEEKLENK